VALIRDLGIELLLDVGTHVFSSGTVSYVGTKVYSETEYFRHGRFHYLRVPRGKYAQIWAEVKDRHGNKSVVHRLLKQGEHFVDNFLFRCDGFVDCSQAYIEHGAVHRISVTKGNVAKIIQDNKPRLLGEGTHLVESTDFSYNGMVSIVSNLVIVHRTITILRVTLGKIALAWQESLQSLSPSKAFMNAIARTLNLLNFEIRRKTSLLLEPKRLFLYKLGR